MIDLVPLTEFSERYSKGWRMVAGYPLEPGDYAVTMQSPGHRDPVKSNLTRAAEQGTRGWAHSTKPRKFRHVDGAAS